jgi:hypothetical protein
MIWLLFFLGFLGFQSAVCLIIKRFQQCQDINTFVITGPATVTVTIGQASYIGARFFSGGAGGAAGGKIGRPHF